MSNFLKSKTALKIIKITAIIITHDNKKKYISKHKINDLIGRFSKIILPKK